MLYENYSIAKVDLNKNEINSVLKKWILVQGVKFEKKWFLIIFFYFYHANNLQLVRQHIIVPELTNQLACFI